MDNVQQNSSASTLTDAPLLDRDLFMVKPVFQLVATAEPDASRTVGQVETSIREAICRWLEGETGEALSASARTGESFEITSPSWRVECAAVPEDRLWSVRLTRHTSLSVADGIPSEAVLITEVATVRERTLVRLAVRGLHVATYDEPDVVTRDMPGFIRDIASSFLLREARQIRSEAWRLRTEADLWELYELLQSPNRALPVYLLTAPDERDLSMRVAPFLLDETRLAQRVSGLAYVVALPRDLGYKWTDMVGKPWSAYLGAVRTYYPGLNFDTDLPTKHPRIFAERILAFEYRGQRMESAFEEFLVDSAFRYSASRRVDWGACLFYDDARRRQSELQRARAADDSEWRRLYDEELASLKARLRHVEKERDDALALAGEAEHERDARADENYRLRARVEYLTRALTQRTGQSVDDPTSIPDNYDDMPEWVNKHLAARLILHPRAVNRGLKNPQFENIEMVYRVLLLLANEYRDMRLGREGAKVRFETHLNEMNLRWGNAISRERAGEQGDTYFVRYPYSTSPPRFIEDHIRSNSNTRDPKRCLAVYFFWDDETQQVVVCWLPGHLDNRLT